MSQDDESFAKEIFSILKWFSVFLVVILLFFVWLLFSSIKEQAHLTLERTEIRDVILLKVNPP